MLARRVRRAHGRSKWEGGLRPRQRANGGGGGGNGARAAVGGPPAQGLAAVSHGLLCHANLARPQRGSPAHDPLRADARGGRGRVVPNLSARRVYLVTQAARIEGHLAGGWGRGVVE